jgi:hypothetical protein
MKLTARLRYATPLLFWSALGVGSLAACLLIALNPALLLICAAAINGNHGALMGTMLGFGALMQQLGADRSMPRGLKILAGTSSFLAAIVAMVVIAFLGWWFLAGVALLIVGSWFASGRPKLPNWKEFNGR